MTSWHFLFIGMSIYVIGIILEIKSKKLIKLKIL